MITLPLLLAVSSLVTPVKTPLRWTAANAVLAVADFETARAVQHPLRWNSSHTRYSYCYESNRWLGGRRPSRSAFYARGLGLDAGLELAGWAVSRKAKRARWLWRVPFGVVSYWHTSGLASNLACP